VRVEGLCFINMFFDNLKMKYTKKRMKM
jgi:hypothetical protein